MEGNRITLNGEALCFSSTIPYQSSPWLYMIFQRPVWSYMPPTKIMASGSITSWEIDGETVETVSDFILGGSKITVDGSAAMKLKDAYSLEGKL